MYLDALLILYGTSCKEFDILYKRYDQMLWLTYDNVMKLLLAAVQTLQGHTCLKWLHQSIKLLGKCVQLHWRCTLHQLEKRFA